MIWLSTPAAAQSGGFDAHGFRYASATADLRAPIEFVRPGALSAPGGSIGLAAEYASRPVVFELDGERTVPLKNVVAANLVGGFSPIDRLQVDVSLPVYLTATRPEDVVGPVAGDVRANLLLEAVRPSDAGGFGLGLTAALEAPTGAPAWYLGTFGTAGSLALTSTIEVERTTFSWTAGARLAPSTAVADRPAPTRGGDTVEASASLAQLATDTVGVGIEAHLSFPIDGDVRTAIGIPATSLASVRWRVAAPVTVVGGVGTGLGLGAGASPVRAVLGVAVGGAREQAPDDADRDGVLDLADPCPDQAEVVNGYRDEDGCPDELPRLVFVARRAGVDDLAVPLTVSTTDGTSREVLGRAEVVGVPGQSFKAVAALGGCMGGLAEATIPAEGTVEVPVDLGRVDAQLTVVVTDGAGRPLEGAEVKYLIDDEACAPADTTLVAGRGVHQVGAGTFLVFLTAPGYGVYQTELTLEPGERRLLDPKLSPTGVALKDGRMTLVEPIAFVASTATLGGPSRVLLGQVASVMMTQDGRRFEVHAWAPAGGTRALAANRAQAVIDELVALGMPADRLIAVGEGPLPRGQRDPVTFVVLPP